MEVKRPYEINFQPVGKRVMVAAGTTIFEAARQAGIELSAACGGEGSCGQCQVVLLEGKVNAPTSDEEFFIPEKDRKEGYRLACRTHSQSDLIIHLPKDSLVTGQRLQIESNLKAIEPEPLVKAYPVELQSPSLDDIRSDLSRLRDSLERNMG
jgi:uncharacterized 2Fe-2S/4Fe-4S cluster protein (DUF4445 family)